MKFNFTNHYKLELQTANESMGSILVADRAIMLAWSKEVDTLTRKLLEAYKKYNFAVLPRNGKTYKESNQIERLDILITTIQNGLWEDRSYKGEYDWMDEKAQDLMTFFKGRTDFMEALATNTKDFLRPGV